MRAEPLVRPHAPEDGMDDSTVEKTERLDVRPGT